MPDDGMHSALLGAPAGEGADLIAFTIFSVLVYLVIWRMPRFGKPTTVILLSLQLLFYAYATTPTTWFYIKLVEHNSGVKLIGDVDIRWGWASHPFGFPRVFSDRAVDVIIASEKIDMKSVRTDWKYSSSLCEIMSAKSRSLFGSNPVAHCWRGLSSSGRDEVYLATSKDFKTLYFWQR